jgi:glycosyltransferase involved in cell wall biosynthesis
LLALPKKEVIVLEISVIIPTYNRYEVLQRALTSVYAQSYMPKEVIIIDDGSTDETSQITKLFPHAKYIYQKNSGVSSARNLGINNSTSQWIAFLDSDDAWHADKLKYQAEFHKQNPKYLISYTDEKWIRNGVEVKMAKKFHKVGGAIFAECLSHCIIAPSSALVHKMLLDEVGLFDENLEVCEDYDLWLRVACANPIGLIDEKLITKYGGNDDQLSAKYWGMDRFRVVALEKLLEFEVAKKDSIIETLLHKYGLLLKGSVKYDKLLDSKMYNEKIKFYEALKD